MSRRNAGLRGFFKMRVCLKYQDKVCCCAAPAGRKLVALPTERERALGGGAGASLRPLGGRVRFPAFAAVAPPPPPPPVLGGRLPPYPLLPSLWWGALGRLGCAPAGARCPVGDTGALCAATRARYVPRADRFATAPRYFATALCRYRRARCVPPLLGRVGARPCAPNGAPFGRVIRG